MYANGAVRNPQATMMPTRIRKKASDSSEKQITNLNQCRQTEHTGSRGATTQEIIKHTFWKNKNSQ